METGVACRTGEPTVLRISVGGEEGGVGDGVGGLPPVLDEVFLGRSSLRRSVLLGGDSRPEVGGKGWVGCHGGNVDCRWIIKWLISGRTCCTWESSY